MSRLTRDGTAKPVSRDLILRHARGQGNIHFPCSADHEQDWQPYPVDPYSAICDDHPSIHTYIHAHRITFASIRILRIYLRASLSLQPISLWESLGRSNRRGSKTSQALYGLPRCSLNLVRLFRLSLILLFFGRFSSSLTHAAINFQSLHMMCCTKPEGLVRRCSSPP